MRFLHALFFKVAFCHQNKSAKNKNSVEQKNLYFRYMCCIISILISGYKKKVVNWNYLEKFYSNNYFLKNITTKTEYKKMLNIAQI